MRTGFDIKKFIGADNSRSALNGIGYRNGRMMACNGRIAAYVAAGYSSENEGKNINPYSGGECDKFPNLEGVIETARKSNAIHIKLDFDRINAALKLCMKNVMNWISISYTLDSGKIVRAGMRCEDLRAVIPALEAYGINEATMCANDVRRAVLFENSEASFLLMPVRVDGCYIDVDGTISANDKLKDRIKMYLEAAENDAAKVPENEKDLRKQKAALKQAARYRKFLKMIEEGTWMDGESSGETSETEQPKANERQAVDAAGRKLYDFIAQGSKALDGKMILSGYFPEDVVHYVAIGLVSGLRDRCKKAEIRVFTPNGRGGNTLVGIQS